MTSQPPRPSFDDILPGLTEASLSSERLSALPPGERVSALARSISGIGAEKTPEGMLDLYLDIVCPERNVFASSAVYRDVNWWRTASGCALVARSILRRFGVRSPHIGLEKDGSRRAYGIGRAVSDVMQVGIDQKAWVAGSDLPPAGSLVIIGTGMATHVLITTADVGEDLVCESVDGGQVMTAEGNLQIQCILPRRRQLKRGGGQLYHEGRAQLGYVDPSKLLPDADPTTDLV